ncbi:DUF4864 domain-containing protein [Cognatiyoonia sp. IB215182]|uniref:DUF4864 domain-containing protein n=1 Tax=Cognatiyoonia sp. IB215182 TaxID=3097353 RepID=UPI002A0FD753|nr:DUF4864 domain-containing protein [Cognatiyoonia sp. IB215182]MDX8351694.1 DUF4864 domain-containing protein [Cognatiyoonia sp. IB215182]
MRRIFAFFTGLWLLVTPAMAQDADAIEGVIGNQLQAFNDRDVAAAWQYASPNIKRLFGNPGNFGMMVQQGYPMVWDNADVRFLELREVSGRLWQKIMIRDAAGGLHVLDYQMVETSEGWQINGVQLLPPPDVGA